MTRFDSGLCPPVPLLKSRVHWFAALGSGAPNDASMPACHLSCLSAMPIRCHPVLHGFEGSAWVLSLGAPLSDLRLLCGSIDGGRGGESRETLTKFSNFFFRSVETCKRENRLLWGSIDAMGGESRNVHPNSQRENVKT